MPSSKKTKIPANRPRTDQGAPATISGRWLLMALAITLPAALFCTWAVFCVFFWQGSWQLLYHPTSVITETPASVSLAYDSVSFATGDDGAAQIRGWWIPSRDARFTVLYLHDEKGNMSDAIAIIENLQQSGGNVFVFDYRGYGQSHFEHPSEARWRQDAEWALGYLSGTRHIVPQNTVIVGQGLGADLALQVAASHPDLAGVVLASPIGTPVDAIFNDARAKLLPAHLLVRDRYDLKSPAERLRVPSLWLLDKRGIADSTIQKAFREVSAPKSQEAVNGSDDSDELLKDWLANLSKQSPVKP